MTETKTIKIDNNQLVESIKTLEVFEWKVVNKDVGPYKSILTLERETDTPYYSKLVEYEKEWNKQMVIKNTAVYVFLAIALVILTTAGIMKFVFLNDKTIGYVVYGLLGGGLFFFLLGALFFYLNIKKMQKNIPLYFEKRREFMLKIKELKENGNTL